MIQPLKNVIAAQARIKNYIINTPILESEFLNQAIGHNFYFKVDALQKTGAFKIRAVLNHLLALQEEGSLPPMVVCYSTGNHAIAVAYVCKLLAIVCRIYLPKSTAYLKVHLTRNLGAEVIYTQDRQEAEILSRADIENGFYFLHPSDSDLSIAGSATMCFEALNALPFKPNAIFGACGGGGLLSGSYLAKELASPHSMLFGCEPENASDAFISRQQQSIFTFKQTPKTIADGLIALRLSDRTFNYIKKLDGMFLANEEKIAYWTIWLSYLLKITVEPSCAINMEGALQWLRSQPLAKQKILILISGGNIDHNFYANLWLHKDHLETLPTLG